jgi:hypothetical protein
MARRIRTTIISILLVYGATAHADEARGRQLFDEGRVALQRGDLNVACAKFRESLAIDGSVGPLLNLAECEERRGRLATALDLWRRASGRTRDGVEADFVRERIADLSPRVPRLSLRPAPDLPPGARVILDGSAVAPDGTGVAVDPGAH